MEQIVMKGKPCADAVKAELIEKINNFKASYGRVPKLCIVRVGAKEENLAYERSAKKRMEMLGIDLKIDELPENINEEDFVSEFAKVNSDDDIDGVMVFQPLPKHLAVVDLAGLINPAKDVDGMSPVNQAKVFSGDTSGFAPCTAEAVMVMLKHYGIELLGKKVAVVGRSMVVGRPLSMLMLNQNATVKICHSRTTDLTDELSDQDIVVAAVGRAEMIKGEMIKEGAVVADVGINFTEEGRMCRDVDFESAVTRASYISPVPAGVGSVTTSVLAMHVVRAAEQRL